MSLDRRHFTLSLGALALAPLGAARAQSWPTRSVRIVVPFGAGGATDIYARIVGQHLQAALGQPVVIENRPGGNFAIGTELVAKSPPDGYTLVMITSSHSVIEALGVNRTKYQLMRDLVPVATLSSAEGVLVIHPSLPAANLREFIALTKSKPGQINYASTGNGSMLHLQAKLLESMAGLDMVHVPYKTGGAARVDLLEGRVQAMVHPVTGATALIREGKLRALGTTGSQRSAALPDVPTLAEAGVPGYDVPVIIGLAAPAGTPKPVIDRLSTEINAILKRPDVQEAWAKADSKTLTLSPEQFGQALEAEITRWGKVIRDAKITMD
jgi:tripartite-type tricarboxylate transporter receptor subunit TctC